MVKNSNTEEEPLTPKEADEKNNSDLDKRKKIKKVLLIAIPIVITIIGGLYFFFFVIKAPKEQQPTAEQSTEQKQQVLLESNTYLDIDPITVGLTPSGNKREFLRMDLSLKLGSEQEGAAVLTKMPIIKDSLITFLRSLRSTDFNSSSSTIYLKEEISKRINKIIAPITIKEVLFQEITVN